MCPRSAGLVAILAFAAVVVRGVSAAPTPGLTLSTDARGGASAATPAAAALPWGRDKGGGGSNVAASSVASVGKTVKKKRRKRVSSSSTSATSGSGSSKARKAEDLTAPNNIASSVGVSAVDGGAAASDAATAVVADPEEIAKGRRTSLALGGAGGKMPSLFNSPDESMYDRYSACLAATEGLRRARDASLSRGKKRRGGRSSAVDHEHRGGLLSMMKRQGGGGDGTAGNRDEEYKRACAQYVLQSSRVIRALGLSVSQFNQLGREVGNDPVLKERVMEQAYLYRMAATLKMQKMPLIEDPSSEQLLKAHRRRRVQMFARSMTEIEELRSEQTERLKRSLNVDQLPDGINICDPSIQPLLNPKVRAVCEAFPLQAEIIVKKYGLNSDEFNQMLEETRRNPIFRWRVKKYMGKSGEKPAE